MFLLGEGKFMHEKHLRQSGFTNSSCRPFIKNKERIQKFEGTEDLGYICQNKLDKGVFQQDMNVLKHLILLKVHKTMETKEVLLQCFINFLKERLLPGTGSRINS